MAISTIALTGLNRALEQFDRAAEGIQRATANTEGPRDRADLSTEAIKLLAAETAVKASLGVLEAEEEIARHTIDLLA